MKPATFRSEMTGFVWRAVVAVGSRVPPRLGRPVGRGLGLVGFHAIRYRRALVVSNLARAFGLEPSDRRVRELARSNYVHYGLLAMELLRLRHVRRDNLDELVSFSGLEHLDAALEAGKGVLALTGHVGNYDLAAVAMSLRGYPLTIVSKPLRDKGLEAIWMRDREASGLEILMSRNSLRDILRALRANRTVGFVLDQHAARDGVWVEFFGRPASTLRSLAVIAARTSAPVIPIFGHREIDGRHVVTVQPAVELEVSGDPEVDVLRNTQRFTTIIEQAVRAAPDQWTWIHRRWRQPPS